MSGKSEVWEKFPQFPIRNYEMEGCSEWILPICKEDISHFPVVLNTAAVGAIGWCCVWLEWKRAYTWFWLPHGWEPPYCVAYFFFLCTVRNVHGVEMSYYLGFNMPIYPLQQFPIYLLCFAVILTTFFSLYNWPPKGWHPAGWHHWPPPPSRSGQALDCRPARLLSLSGNTASLQTWIVSLCRHNCPFCRRGRGLAGHRGIMRWPGFRGHYTHCLRSISCNASLAHCPLFSEQPRALLQQHQASCILQYLTIIKFMCNTV